MKLETVKQARKEAADFIMRCNDLVKYQEEVKSEYVFGSKASAALRRKSMDLTRVLSKLRSSG